ncbi:MAG: type II toxin-antitoxin system Phd/YefM family antitoxin [Sulfuritalea sp.]|nr:type II toxin-antitoxin system Phd/YefM family antitoxin [Sulfuritalea sp.]MBK8120201.1 type II toxin-antitoxin system Phd/YefM family antitoxin [Sulfuritalea sp.]
MTPVFGGGSGGRDASDALPLFFEQGRRLRGDLAVGEGGLADQAPVFEHFQRAALVQFGKQRPWVEAGIAFEEADEKREGLRGRPGDRGYLVQARYGAELVVAARPEEAADDRQRDQVAGEGQRPDDPEDRLDDDLAAIAATATVKPAAGIQAEYPLAYCRTALAGTAWNRACSAELGRTLSCRATDEPVTVTRVDGRNVVIVSESEWVSISETLHLMSSSVNEQRPNHATAEIVAEIARRAA